MGSKMQLSCPKCGHKNTAGAVLCFKCGDVLGMTTEGPPPSPTLPGMPEPAPTTTKKAPKKAPVGRMPRLDTPPSSTACPACGYDNAGDALTCALCGRMFRKAGH